MGAKGHHLESSARVPGVREAELGGRGPQQDTGAGTVQEQGPSGALSGRFLRARVSPKNPQNPIGGVSVWAAVTLKGFGNHTL